MRTQYARREPFSSLAQADAHLPAGLARRDHGARTRIVAALKVFSGSLEGLPEPVTCDSPVSLNYLKFIGGSAATRKCPYLRQNSHQKRNRPMTALPKAVTASELARLWGCGDRMVRQLAEKGVVVRAERGRYDLEQSTRNYIDDLRAAAAGRANREALTPQQRLKTRRPSWPRSISRRNAVRCSTATRYKTRGKHSC
jgi:hypothetical protein